MGHNERYGCKWGIPHDPRIVYQDKKIKVEKCTICNKQFRWHKGPRGRVQNKEYLKVHIRNFCQKFGATKRIYHKIYKSDKMKIRL